jgi:hypothetical protein
LDLITIAYNAIREDVAKNSYAGRGIITQRLDDYLREVREIFQDDDLNFDIDVRGGVHYRFDEEFVRAKAATIAALQGSRYENVRNLFERGFAELSKPIPDGKHAIRGIFAAAEGLFRLMFSKSPALKADEAEKLVPYIQRATAGDPTAERAAVKMLAAFKDWIDAVHNYRHEPGTAKVAQPPVSLAVHLVSTGAAHIRWLAELDQGT